MTFPGAVLDGYVHFVLKINRNMALTWHSARKKESTLTKLFFTLPADYLIENMSLEQSHTEFLPGSGFHLHITATRSREKMTGKYNRLIFCLNYTRKYLP